MSSTARWARGSGWGKGLRKEGGGSAGEGTLARSSRWHHGRPGTSQVLFPPPPAPITNTCQVNYEQASELYAQAKRYLNWVTFRQAAARGGGGRGVQRARNRGGNMLLVWRECAWPRIGLSYSRHSNLSAC